MLCFDPIVMLLISTEPSHNGGIYKTSFLYIKKKKSNNGLTTLNVKLCIFP